jgi:transcriptional regulator with XRE-family HTH domain
MIRRHYETQNHSMRDEEFFHALGARIADLRQQAGFSQQQLADLLGLKQQTWATYESATRRLPSSLLVPLCDALNVSVEQLLGVREAKAKPGPAPKLQKQFQAISTLPKSKQDHITRVIEALLAQEGAAA